MSDFLLYALITAAGLGAHITIKWAAERAELQGKVATMPGFKSYISRHPAATAVSVLTTAGAFLVSWQMGWLNPPTALACGYMGDSVVKNLSSKFGRG